MADDVQITAGSGTIIKTDEVAGDHVQYVKLMDGTLNSGTIVPSTSAYGLSVDVTRLGRVINKAGATGSGAISASRTVTNFERLTSITLHFSSAPTTSQDFTITIDMNAGAAYDYQLASFNPAVLSLTDYVFMPDGDLYLQNGDQIVLAYTNTDGRTYGVQITTEDV